MCMPKLHNVPVSQGANPKTVSQFTALNLGSSFNSDPIWCAAVDSGSIQVVTPAAGTPVGTLKVQRSSHKGDYDQWFADDPNTWEWTDWVGASASVNGAAGSPFDFDLTKITCRWVRLVWTWTSGTGTGTGVMSQKGPA